MTQNDDSRKYFVSRSVRLDGKSCLLEILRDTSSTYLALIGKNRSLGAVYSIRNTSNIVQDINLLLSRASAKHNFEAIVYFESENLDSLEVIRHYPDWLS